MSRQHLNVQYRPYTFDPCLPVFAFTDGYRPANQMYALNDDHCIQYVHLHNCIEIGLNFPAGGKLYVNNQTHTVEAGEVVVIMPYCVHIMQEFAAPGENLFSDYLYFDSSAFLRDFCPEALPAGLLFEEKNAPTCTILHGEAARQIQSRACEIIQELKEARSNRNWCIKGLLLALIIELTRALGRENPLEHRDHSMTSIMPAIQYINQHFTKEELHVDLLQNLCHLSGTHFRRIFRSVMGCSPLEYVQTMRITYACSLLISSNASILDIANKAGFDSISSFNRQFMKIMEISPSKWRRTNTQAHSNYMPPSPYIPTGAPDISAL